MLAHERETDTERILAALIFFGEPPERLADVDICENGQVYLGLTEILPRGSVQSC